MTNIELQFYQTVPSILRDIAKELKTLNEHYADTHITPEAVIKTKAAKKNSGE